MASRSSTAPDGTTEIADSGPALVVAAHGSHRNPRSVEPAFAHADRLRATGHFPEVRAAFWKNEPSLRGVLATLESEAAVVVPLFTSEGYFVEELLPREFGTTGAESVPGPGTVRLADPVGTHERATEVIVERAESVTGDPDVGSGVGLAVVGHGTERNERSARATRAHADRIRESGRFAEVRALFMDEPPYVDDLADRFEADDVVVVPLFVADGYHTTEDVPEDAGLTDDHRDGWDVPADVDGHRVWYAGAVGTEPGFADVVLERAREALETGVESGDAATADPEPADGSATGAGRPPLDPEGHRRAFLDWLADATSDRDDAARTWGELAITVSRAGDDGNDCRRRFALRHRDDRGRPLDELDVREDPAAARELARYDERGRFRPLAGARSLRRGWALVGLDGPGLLRAVDDVYPGSVAAWHDEREGDLDPTGFAETAARQTGIYASVGDADREDVACAIEACCGDCVRRRAWKVGDEDPAAAGRDGGGEAIDAGQDAEATIEAGCEGGEFPCREPCSFLVAALREFADLDVSEATGSEDAAADPSVRVGAFEQSGNRYRARFLAAKRASTDPDESSGDATVDGGDG